VPELPEVETVKRELEGKVLHKKITNIEVIAEGVLKEPSSRQFKKEIIGQSIEEIVRKGKLLIFKLNNGKFLIVHLRIAGWLLYGKTDQKARVVFEFSDGKALNYMDQRLLGEIRLIDDYKDLNFIKKLGPEPFDFGLSEFKDVLKRKKTKIKAALLDQHLIAGLGNIYVQEALFLAKINPERRCCDLEETEVELLLKKTISVLKEAIKHKGSSIDIYRVTDGEKGGMEKRLKVYGRQKEPCFVCGQPIKKIFLAGRGTCFCAHCQK